MVSSCGAAPTPADQIRGNFQRLLKAFHDHDAHTACELLFPYGEHQPDGVLAADVKRLDTSAGRSSYDRTIALCVPSFAKDPGNFTGYEQGLGGAKLGAMTIRGNVAMVEVISKTGKHVSGTFVRAAGEWRVLIDVQ